MFRLITTGRILFLIIPAFVLSVSVSAQKDCAYGLKIYARDEAGKEIEDGKLEVKALSPAGELPRSVKPYVDKGGVYKIVGLRGSTVKGKFLLKISADGFDAYERQFNFPDCEIQSYELRLTAKGATARARFERLLTVHGKVFDEERKPFGNALIEARSAGGRVYRASSNAYGYFEINVPRGTINIRVSDEKIPDVVFDNYTVEKNYSVLNVPVCLRCRQGQSKN
jgi:hypothetical protein